jgi:transposase
MVRLVRAGISMNAVAEKFRVDRSTVWLWVHRAEGQRLDRVDFSARKSGRASNRTARALEQRIAQLRTSLREDSVLGEYGAAAIQGALAAEMAAAPSLATINRVLGRLGLQDGVRRIRRPAPPKGWYLPAVAAGRAELDCFDFIEDLKIAGGPLVDVLTAKSLHGGLTDAWVLASKSTRGTLPRLLQRWQRDGLPGYAQFGNDTVFQGAHHFADTVGAVSRLCLQLRVIPVFVPALEHGMQNSVESFNALWQAKVWGRYRVADLSELQSRSDRYIAAHRICHQRLAEHAPQRRRVPAAFAFEPPARLRGQIIFIRRTDETGQVYMLGQTFSVSRRWCHRLVRCDVDFDHQQIRCFALRRRAPAEQPLLATIAYHQIDKPFKGAL